MRIPDFRDFINSRKEALQCANGKFMILSIAVGVDRDALHHSIMNAERISTRPAKLGGNIRDVAMDGGDVIKLGGNICEVAVDGGDVAVITDGGDVAVITIPFAESDDLRVSLLLLFQELKVFKRGHVLRFASICGPEGRVDNSIQPVAGDTIELFNESWVEVFMRRPVRVFVHFLRLRNGPGDEVARHAHLPFDFVVVELVVGFQHDRLVGVQHDRLIGFQHDRLFVLKLKKW